MLPIDSSPAEPLEESTAPSSIPCERTAAQKRVVDSQVREDLNSCIDGYGQDNPGLVSAIFGPDTDTFSHLAKAEATLFPEMALLPPGNYAFWAVIKAGRVLHAMRASFPTVSNGLLAPFQIHEIVRSGQLGAKEIADEYEDRGHDLANLISVESHFRVESKERFPSTVAIPSHLGMISYCLRTGRTGVLGHLNEISKQQFAGAGVLVEPASIQKALYTPTLDDPRVADRSYSPTLLPKCIQTIQAVELLKELLPRHVETYIDLRKPESGSSETKQKQTSEGLKIS